MGTQLPVPNKEQYERYKKKVLKTKKYWEESRKKELSYVV